MNETNRYIRQQQLPGFGTEAQQKLAQAKVLVVGAGGLGVPALQYLCGMGTGTIGIVDGDMVSLSNLHRQVLYNEADVGLKKAVAAAAKLRALNSEVIINTHDEMLTAPNALSIISNYDLVIDATDNFAARYLINDACVITGKPFIYAAVQGWEGHLSVFNYNDGPTYRCLYPQQPGPAEIPDCNMAGVLGVVPGILGCRQALEAVKIITGAGKTLTGFLKIIDFENGNEYKIKLAVNPHNKQIKTLQQDLQVACAANVNALSPVELFNWYKEGKEFLLVDVREALEFNSGHLHRACHIPYAQIGGSDLPGEKPIILFCKTGSRSSKAAEMLKEKNNTLEVYNLAGGLDDWAALFRDQLIET